MEHIKSKFTQKKIPFLDRKLSLEANLIQLRSPDPTSSSLKNSRFLFIFKSSCDCQLPPGTQLTKSIIPGRSLRPGSFSPSSTRWWLSKPCVTRVMRRNNTTQLPYCDCDSRNERPEAVLTSSCLATVKTQLYCVRALLKNNQVIFDSKFKTVCISSKLSNDSILKKDSEKKKSGKKFLLFDLVPAESCHVSAITILVYCPILLLETTQPMSLSSLAFTNCLLPVTHHLPLVSILKKRSKKSERNIHRQKQN